jgi:hypothetical protein
MIDLVHIVTVHHDCADSIVAAYVSLTKAELHAESLNAREFVKHHGRPPDSGIELDEFMDKGLTYVQQAGVETVEVQP